MGLFNLIVPSFFFFYDYFIITTCLNCMRFCRCLFAISPLSLLSVVSRKIYVSFTGFYVPLTWVSVSYRKLNVMERLRLSHLLNIIFIYVPSIVFGDTYLAASAYYLI